MIPNAWSAQLAAELPRSARLFRTTLPRSLGHWRWAARRPGDRGRGGVVGLLSTWWWGPSGRFALGAGDGGPGARAPVVHKGPANPMGGPSGASGGSPNPMGSSADLMGDFANLTSGSADPIGVCQLRRRSDHGSSTEGQAAAVSSADHPPGLAQVRPSLDRPQTQCPIFPHCTLRANVGPPP